MNDYKYYYGYFRSLDQSVDPLGQQYKVVIITGWNGSSNPYPKKLQPVGAALRNIPDLSRHYELTMTDHPFVVNYEGNTDEKYKPYICSTATISFLQSDFNFDFINETAKKCIAVLLKRKNDVELVNNSYYRNNTTNETLYKTVIQGTGVIPIVYFNGFMPEEEDAFLYDVEWAGYLTPETYSMEYSHIFDRFSLNAQDAFSVTQYDKYAFIGDDILKSMENTLLSFIANTDMYKDVYITDTVCFSGSNVSALKECFQQQWNNFDENDEPIDNLTVMERMLRYFNLTAIPHGDKLYITNMQALAVGFNTYHHYTLNNASRGQQKYIVNWGSASYAVLDDVFISSGHILVGSDFRSNSTTISSSNIYNKVKAVVDEYPVDSLLMDISNNENLRKVDDETGWDNITTGDYFLSGNNHHYWYWEHELWLPNGEFKKGEKLECYYYQHANGQPAYGTPRVEDPTWFTYGNTLIWTPFCAILDNGELKDGQDLSKTTVIKAPYNPDRSLFFNTPFAGNPHPESGRPHNDYNQYWQPLLYARTKDVVIGAGQCLLMKGDWTFYPTCSVQIQRGIPSMVNRESTEKAYVQYAYMACKIKCGGKWLKNGNGPFGIGNYVWGNTEQVCKIFFKIPDDYDPTVPSTIPKAWGTTWSFESTVRNFTDFIIPLPASGDELIPSAVEIWINRPLGVSFSYECQTATLKDFDFQIVPSEYINSRGTENSVDSDTEYETVIVENSVNDYNDVDLKYSSNHEKGIRLSQVAYKQNTGGDNKYHTMREVYNAATAHYLLPENHITTNIAEQYVKPGIMLDTTVINNFPPMCRFSWAKLPDRVFVALSSEYDYEYETVSANLVEIRKTPANCESQRRNRIRNYMRTDDVIMRRGNIRQRLEVLTPGQTDNYNLFLRIGDGSTQYPHAGCVYLSTTDSNVSNLRWQCNFDDGHLLVSLPDNIEDYLDVYVDENGHVKFEDDTLVRQIQSI